MNKEKDCLLLNYHINLRVDKNKFKNICVETLKYLRENYELMVISKANKLYEDDISPKLTNLFGLINHKTSVSGYEKLIRSKIPLETFSEAAMRCIQGINLLEVLVSNDDFYMTIYDIQVIMNSYNEMLEKTEIIKKKEIERAKKLAGVKGD